MVETIMGRYHLGGGHWGGGYGLRALPRPSLCLRPSQVPRKPNAKGLSLMPKAKTPYPPPQSSFPCIYVSYLPPSVLYPTIISKMRQNITGDRKIFRLKIYFFKTIAIPFQSRII